jgi:hypothetical protein
MPAGPRKLLLTLHIVLSISWLGLEATQVVLGLSVVSSADAERVKATYLVMAFVGTTIVPPAAVGSLVTGLLLGLGTPWGLLRHYWVTVKLVINVTLVLVGHQVLRHWLTWQAEVVLAAPGATLTATDVGSIRIRLLAGLTTALVLLTAAAALSVYKPWGRTPRGWRQLARQRPAAAGPAQSALRGRGSERARYARPAQGIPRPQERPLTPGHHRIPDEVTAGEDPQVPVEEGEGAGGDQARTGNGRDPARARAEPTLHPTSGSVSQHQEDHALSGGYCRWIRA